MHHFRWIEPYLWGSKRFWSLMQNLEVSEARLDKYGSILCSNTNERSCEEDVYLNTNLKIVEQNLAFKIVLAPD